MLGISGQTARLYLLHICIPFSMATRITATVKTVIPRVLYRSPQLKKKKLSTVIQKFGIKTIINLRGVNKNQRWYQDEHSIANAHNIPVYDISLSARRLPSKAQVRRLIQIFNTAQNPILIHCQRGIDRTGAIAGLYVLENDLTHNVPFHTAKKRARRQLSLLRYGHIRALFPAADKFLQMWIKLRSKHTNSMHAIDCYRPEHIAGFPVS